MKVYTIQAEEILYKLEKTSKVFADKRFICAKDFRSSYNWYLKQAQKYCPAWEGDSMWWVWLEKPDLRAWRYFRDTRSGKTKNMVLLELEIDPKLILVSDFELWHFVLNQSYLPYNEKEDKRFDKRSKGKLFESLPKNLKKEVVKSWERCLKLGSTSFKKFSKDFLSQKQIFQGIIPYIEKVQVKKVKRFEMINRLKK